MCALCFKMQTLRETNSQPLQRWRLCNAHGPCIEICIKIRKKDTYQYHRWHWAVRSCRAWRLRCNPPSPLIQPSICVDTRACQWSQTAGLSQHTSSPADTARLDPPYAPTANRQKQRNLTQTHTNTKDRLLEKDHAVHNQWILTSRPFFLTHARRPSTFQEVIFMLDARPSLLVILSGGSSYRIGASGSFPFFSFFAGSVKENSMLSDALWRCKLCFLYALLKLYQLRCQSPRRQLPRSSWLF